MPPAPIAIDLGELPRGGEPELDPPWPILKRLRWLRNRPAWRMVGAALAVAMVTVTAAAAPLRSPLTLQLAVDGASVAFADQQNLYLLPDPEVPGEVTVAAHRLDGGALRWETSLPGSRDSIWLDELDGALLAYSSPDEFLDEERARVTRLDPDSGEPLWTHYGQRAGGDHGRLLLARSLPTVLVDEQGEYVHLDGHDAREVTAVDPITGRPEWIIQTIGLITAALDGDPPALLTLDQEGGLSSYDLTTGEQLATTTVDDGRSEADRIVMAIGSVAVVSTYQDGRSVITGYEPASLAPQWRLTDLTRTHGPDLLLPCGPVMCVSGNGEVRALDPATGETVWSPDWAPVGGGHTELFDPETAPLAGYLVLARFGESDDDHASWLVDAESGEQVLELGRWSLDLYFGWPSRDDPTAVPVLRSQADGSTWVGQLRADLSGVDPLMALDTAEPDSCRIHPPYVLCGSSLWIGDDPGRVEVWRLP